MHLNFVGFFFCGCKLLVIFKKMASGGNNSVLDFDSESGEK